MNSIDNLKATLSKKGGVAFANRFQVFFTPPTAALSALASKDIGSLLGSLVGGGSIKNLIPDPRDISILCESVTLPGRNINTLDYQADKQAIKIPYGIINEDVVMSFILTNDYAMKKMFDDWMESIFNVEEYRAGYKKDFTTDIVIQQLNQKNVPVYGVVLQNAFPTTVAGITLDSNSENTIQKLNVTFSYENYVPESAISSALSGLSAAAGIFG